VVLALGKRPPIRPKVAKASLIALRRNAFVRLASKGAIAARGVDQHAVAAKRRIARSLALLGV